MKIKQYTMDEVAVICLESGMRGWPTVTAISIAWAESGGNAYAVNINDGNPDNQAYLSMDLGLWQTNTFWHPEIPIAEAFTPVNQIIHVRRIAERTESWSWIAYDWSAWNTYKAKLHQKFTAPAVTAVRNAGGVL